MIFLYIVDFEREYILNTIVNKKAFTLSEALIALVIIGIVAALTVPNIVFKYNDDVTVKRVTKFYATMSVAYQKIKFEEGVPEDWGELNEDRTNNGRVFYEKFKKHLSILKDCSNDQPGCFASSSYKLFSGGFSENFTSARARYNAILLDGSAVSFYVHPKSTFTYNEGKDRKGGLGLVYLDVNGAKPPNQFGKDMFQFDITEDAIYPPMVTKREISNCLSAGYYCSGWIIAYQNMDYKYCPQEILAGKPNCGMK